MSSFVTNEINLKQVAIKKNKIPKISIRFHPISRYFEHLLQRLSFVLAEKSFAKKIFIRLNLFYTIMSEFSTIVSV
jgi:hypothetical protein